MKKILFVSLLALTAYLYLQNRASSALVGAMNVAPQEEQPAEVARKVFVVAPAPSTYNRWKSGPLAQNDWKTGPNAQTDFEPFAPSEQADWNHSAGGYTIVSGAFIKR